MYLENKYISKAKFELLEIDTDNSKNPYPKITFVQFYNEIADYIHVCFEEYKTLLFYATQSFLCHFLGYCFNVILIVI